MVEQMVAIRLRKPLDTDNMLLGGARSLTKMGGKAGSFVTAGVKGGGRGKWGGVLGGAVCC